MIIKICVLLTYIYTLFQTDPERTDYALEDGATRNFEPTRTAEMLAEQEQKEKEEEERNNPMKVKEMFISCDV